jgi:hypothetical protein
MQTPRWLGEANQRGDAFSRAPRSAFLRVFPHLD